MCDFNSTQLEAVFEQEQLAGKRADQRDTHPSR